MTDHATIARDNALSVEAKKHGYRQSKDGIVVSFVLHPAEIPDALATADLGTRYMMVLVALNDDETPKEVMPHKPISPDGQHNAQPDPVNNKPPDRAEISPDKPVKERKPTKPEDRLKLRAALLCSAPAFWTYVNEEYASNSTIDSAEAAAIFVRDLCGVTSRREILPGTPAGDKFEHLYSDFTIWRDHPELVAS